MTDAARVDAALRREDLRGRVSVIENNPGTPGEVVMWIDGAGVPVYSVREAVDFVHDVIRDEEDG